MDITDPMDDHMHRHGNNMHRNVASIRPQVLYQQFGQSHITDNASTITSTSNYLPDASTNFDSSRMHNSIGNRRADSFQQISLDPNNFAPSNSTFPANFTSADYGASRAPYLSSALYPDSLGSEDSYNIPPPCNTTGKLPTTYFSSSSGVTSTYAETLNERQTNQQSPNRPSITQGSQHNARPRDGKVLLCPFSGCNRQNKPFSRSDNRLNHLRGVHGKMIPKRKGRRPSIRAVGNSVDNQQTLVRIPFKRLAEKNSYPPTN